MENSRSLWDAARQFFPGGVNSPVRAFRAVGEEPVVAVRGEGAYLIDADGRRFLFSERSSRNLSESRWPCVCSPMTAD
jgi:aspartate oxidase